VAVVVTLSKGYDLEYIWRQVDQGVRKSAAEYYIQASEKGGEPPGRWWGPGAQALGFASGQLVEREPYDLLFGERKAPDGTALGRSPSNGRTTADLYARLTAAEPHATAERKRELRAEAAARSRPSPLFFDLTISLSKSISIFHASLAENARLARQAGDPDGEAYWADLVAEVEDMIWQAVRAGFGYFQREAGYTRTGSHARRVGGRETGQWREADLAVAHWLQHTSRDGDMQLHVHSQIAHVARTQLDGKWRAPDSLGYHEHLGAVEAIVSQHLEEALTGRFGVEWVARDDGHGFEIAGIGDQMMRVFSTRRESITRDARERARVFAAQYGRAPSQRELAHLAQASNFTTRAPKSHASIDADDLHENWSQRLEHALGVRFASVAPTVWGERHARTADPRHAIHEPTPLQLRRAAQTALALAQDAKSAFTRADLTKYLGRVLPRTGTAPDAAAGLLESIASRALAGEFGKVTCLEAPEPVPTPDCLRRADGRSVYQRHGGVKYATRVQLSTEEQLVAQAQATGAPAMTRTQVARAVGASVTQLNAALTRGTQPGTAPDWRTRTGLREDQAAALLAVLTDSHLVSVINAPAGSGKTRVLTDAARAWTETGIGEVIGVTPSQSARNTLAAGVPECYNIAQFLGHLRSGRGALGPMAIRPGTLILADEASMISTPDLADLIAHARKSRAKVILAGDTEQLQAVESGGGLSLLAATLGYARLTEPTRFAAAWERAASLRLRQGDTTVLAEYDEHGRIRGGDPEQMLDAAARDYLAWTLDGADVLLMTADHARRRELSRRIRDDLIHLGIVSDGRSVRIADGARASTGDLIICTSNDHNTEAGEPGRALANGDLLRIEAITQRGLLVRRALDCDRATGTRRWTDQPFLFAGYKDSELGYAVTDHTAQSRTVRAGLTLITGTEDRQHAYVALTRGTHVNTAYVFTISPKTADPAPGPTPAPELARFDRLTAARTGNPDPLAEPDPASPAQAVLAAVLERNGQELSATEQLTSNLANADHLAVLHAIWTGETTPAREQRYRNLLNSALPPDLRAEPGHQARWLWRTLRAAELAGLDPRDILTAAASQRSLSDARDIAAVIDARIRQRLGTLVPLPPRTWSEQVPPPPDPDRQHYLTEIAAAMDARTSRIGEHAADHALPWATSALGPVPQDPLDRLEWQARASTIGAYRELHGYDHPTDPIGPEPASDSPDKRAAWHHALTALGPATEPDLRDKPDGSLLHLRDTYPIEAAWAPRWVGDQLRQVRRGAQDARLAAIRAAAEARAAACQGHQDTARRHQNLAASYQAMQTAYNQRETVLAATMDDRHQWEQATANQRRLAVAADAELRRRHPAQKHDPLRSAEPAPLNQAETEELNLSPDRPIPEPGQWIKDLAAARDTFTKILEEKRRQPVTEQSHQPIGLGHLFPGQPHHAADAILQPPKPQIQPSARVLERMQEREPGLEAGN
jgi:conjugative relaxase-like TrwC/TraI family protein